MLDFEAIARLVFLCGSAAALFQAGDYALQAFRQTQEHEE